MEFRTLRIAELNKWYELCGEIFAIGSKYFKMHYENDPWLDINGIFVCVDHGDLVGSVRVFQRYIYYHGSQVKMGGIGEVCTRSSYRGKGIASTLLEMAIEYMEENKFRVSVLGSGADQLYNSLGWEGRRLVKNKLLVEAEKSDAFSIIGVYNGIEYIEKFKEMHESFSKRFNGPIVRSDDYWEKWFLYEAGRRELFMIVKDSEGILIGYIVGNLREGIYIIDELILDLAYESYFDEIIKSLAFALDKGEIQVIVPDVYETAIEPSEIIVENHWMYRNNYDEEFTDVLKGNKVLGSRHPHLLWGIDDF